MFFTLAVSAENPALCADLTDRARIADPAVLPICWEDPAGEARLAA